MDRIWRTAPPGTREWLESGAAPADLRSALLDVARARAARVRPADVVERWHSDRFVRPSSVDPRRLSALEAAIWQAVPAEFTGVELSPVAPLGTVAAVTGLNQDRTVTTTRLHEVVSDSTNALAVEAAVRRSALPTGEAVHLAGAHRQLRAQSFGPGASSHFRLFALVSSARDTGSGSTEADLLDRHVGVWRTVLAQLVPTASPRVEVSVFEAGPTAERLADTALPRHRDGVAPLVEASDRVRGRGYYAPLALRLSADDGAIELGDGGFTDWTARLRADRKERCLVSCVSVERLAELAG